MDNQELQELVRRLSLKSFQRPFLHQAYFNARLRSTGGRYLYNLIILRLILKPMSYTVWKKFKVLFYTNYAIIIYILKERVSASR